MVSVSRSGLLALLADELDAARAQLDALGLALADDAELARRHLIELQALDHAGQRCAAIAVILRADDSHAATLDAPLESIAARLGR
ncbi:hypothetical protein HRJ34_16585 [Rhizorhabdus wittichii]|uniref:Uncharacterized protein n=1 Tax=Rhizorhabdus wittichii TaxID=160791 RepID=A0A975D1G4_9SPHN|nr:hypothetical protein [Rhizorhabdus wittichii]QTH19975.1 hypothetical protein HRJ34_16585 [Rhizorhabdus wittichii]